MRERCWLSMLTPPLATSRPRRRLEDSAYANLSRRFAIAWPAQRVTLAESERRMLHATVRQRRRAQPRGGLRTTSVGTCRRTCVFTPVPARRAGLKLGFTARRISTEFLSSFSGNGGEISDSYGASNVTAYY